MREQVVHGKKNSPSDLNLSALSSIYKKSKRAYYATPHLTN